MCNPRQKKLNTFAPPSPCQRCSVEDIIMIKTEQYEPTLRWMGGGRDGIEEVKKYCNGEKE